MISELLSQCGLNSTEQKVFMCLLEEGELVASVVAKKTKLKRPTVYAALESLMQRGIIKNNKFAKVMFFSAHTPEMVGKVLKARAEKDYAKQQGVADQLAAQLPSYYKDTTKEGDFTINTLTNLDAIFIQIEETLLSGALDVCFDPQEVLRDANKKAIAKFYLGATGKKKTQIREILVDGPEADWYESKINNPNHKIKRIAKSKKLHSAMVISKNAVLLVNQDQDNPVGIKIRHEKFTHSMRTLHSALWDNLD
jgi:sugar-specific transcriptional regulator TrmB